MVPLALTGMDGGSFLGDSFEICQYAASASGGRLAPVTESWAVKLDLFVRTSLPTRYQLDIWQLF